MREILLKENERIDDLQRNGYCIIQDPDRFCFGMDAVLLSGFAVVKDGARVLDLGTGTGIIPILLEAKTGAAHLTGPFPASFLEQFQLRSHRSDFRTVLSGGFQFRPRY